ncbi:MarR family transcriptional regulator [Paenibacillus filicis]|uniref:MarR family transcriptional regulator n=1 Tax=Paenibacillus filicis TaxID=669464 RepID=A0ABU9DTK2_9BACL
MQSDLNSLSIGFIIGQTYRKMSNVFAMRLREHDMTTEQFSVLHRLYQTDGISQKEIAERTVKDQPTTARILDLLIRKELVRKEMSPTDRRSFLVFLTPSGRNKTELLIPIEQGVVQDIFGDIDSSELDQLRQTLLSLHSRLESLLEGGGRS